ncbi:prepilin peptidase [Candidatus Dependentiae bacterium]
MITLLFIVFIFSLCWGSFLNVVAYRCITQKSFFEKRSTCNFCKNLIPWYDNIPIISWIILKAQCRNCKKKISWLYPLIEILTAVIITALFFKVFNLDNTVILSSQLTYSFICYFIFFSSLIVAIRTDLQALVIPQIFSIWMVPFGLICSYLNLIEISFKQSLIGSILGYASLLVVAKLFKFFAKKEGLGIGDMELLSMIGAFLGPLGVWFSITIGSLTGVIISGSYLFISKKSTHTLIPFGPFLALGAILYFFIQNFSF